MFPLVWLLSCYAVEEGFGVKLGVPAILASNMLAAEVHFSVKSSVSPCVVLYTADHVLPCVVLDVRSSTLLTMSSY